MARKRLDAELVRRGLARSREQAQELITAGLVTVKGTVATKAATQVDTSDPVEVVLTEGHGYVSRGAVKLNGALDSFSLIDVENRLCLDAGASTGGFTQVLLERGAAKVLAVDVGYGQLAWPVRTDERVVVMERTNIRTLTKDVVEYLADLVVADLSFISLGVVLPAMIECTAADADFVLMVKPQFEVGREAVGDGVVRDPQARKAAVAGVAQRAISLGLEVVGVAASPLPGPSGNVEYFLWMQKGAGGKPVDDAPRPELLRDDVLQLAISSAIEKGPQ